MRLDAQPLHGRTVISAFLISDVTIRDADVFQVYRSRAATSIFKHGGNYLVRGGTVELLEGAWMPRVIIVVEFPSMEQGLVWYRSPEYAFALKVREIALSRNLILVDGIGGSKQ